MTSRESIAAELASLRERGLERRLQAVDGPQAAEISLAGQRVVHLSSNNYLGLADDPDLAAAAAQAMRTHGFGAGASRLIAGNLAPHRALEAQIAAWQGTDAALLFNSGYHANLGVLSALVGPGDALFSDALNHASIIDGARLSRANVHIYPHRDAAALAQLLAAPGATRRRLIVTESLFSMDGDVAPLAEIAALAKAHDAITVVDEAHAVGALGPAGRGLSAGLPIDLRMGTFGKALGGFGAYVAGPAALIDLLLQRSRSFVFTTALPVPVVAHAAAALDRISGPAGQPLRERLAAAANHFSTGLRARGLAHASAPHHIIPLPVGEAAATMRLSTALLDRGIFAHGIRPPTVPEGTSRLRISLMATHSAAQIDRALDALEWLRALLP